MLSDRFIESLLGRMLGRLARDLLQAAVWISAVLLVAFAIGFHLPLALRNLERLHYNDFGRFYYSTEQAVHGLNMYQPSPATPLQFSASDVVQLLDMNPPHLHLLTLPLARLPIQQAFWVWAAAGLSCLIASAVVIFRELRPRVTAATVAWVLCGTLASSATAVTVVTGQLTFLLLLPMTLAWRAARDGRWVRAGLYLGPLTSVKIFCGIFVLYLALLGRWRAVGSAVLSAATVCGLGVFAFGWTQYANWLHALSSVSWEWLPMNASLFALISRAVSPNPVFVTPWIAPSLTVPTAAALAASAILLSLARLSRSLDPQSVDRSFLVLTLLAILASPLGWIYYGWLVAAPVAAVWLQPGTRSSKWRDWFLALGVPGAFLPIELTSAWAQHRWGGVTLGSLYTWSTLALWAAALIDSRGAKDRSDPPGR